MDDLATEPRFHPAIVSAKNSLKGKSQFAIANKLFFDSMQKTLNERKSVKTYEQQYAYEVNEALANQLQWKIHSKVVNVNGDYKYLQPLNELQNDLRRFDYKTSSIFESKRYFNRL